MKRTPEWRSWLPNIAVVIVLPFFRFETFMMYERMESMTVEWTGIHINLWRYRFDFKWYWKPIY